MSVQFGRCNFDGRPVDRNYLEKVNRIITPCGSDDGGCYSQPNIGILYRALHTTKESRRERQPHISQSGAVITWDGRLDNRDELIRSLRTVLTTSSTDVAIVAAAYEEWGNDCFAKLIGDWALSIWDANARALILAKDPIGTRHLYYSADQDQVTWSTILDPLVLFAGKSFALCEEYIAGWFSFFPAAHLTPYVGIHSVPPSSSVLFRTGKQTNSKYWEFDPGKSIRYRTDAEYEEHFRAVFAEAVRRRLRSDRPILAELSGGMDSSSIVCMADTIIARGSGETPRLDTVSYLNDSEPNWNERPYFTKVEEKRGRTGCHIDVSKLESFRFEFGSERFPATPGSGRRLNEASRQFAACLNSQGNRVVLSGIGGDEVTGGVPTPAPELEDLLARGQFRTLVHQLKVWALNQRKPWFYLFFEAARRFFPPAFVGVPKRRRPVHWLNPQFVKRNRAALEGYPSRVKLFGAPPSFQENLSTLHGLRRQFGCLVANIEPSYERRYPFVDRSLLEFLLSIPLEQLVRPGQRRSLMRRALVGIVPDELLNRKRKAFVARAPIGLMSPDARSGGPTEIVKDMVSSRLGMVDSTVLSETLRRVGRGSEVPLAPLIRTLNIESWLRTVTNWKLPDQRQVICARDSVLRPKTGDADGVAFLGSSAS